MIIHKQQDGSEGYEYEPGDQVIVERTIAGDWFNIGPTKSSCCIVRRIDKKHDWRIAMHFIHYSNEWGLAECYPWMLKPTEETLNKARTVYSIGRV